MHEKDTHEKVDGVADTGCTRRGAVAVGSFTNPLTEFVTSYVDSGMTSDISGYVSAREFPGTGAWMKS
jgi:hypothetical protein